MIPKGHTRQIDLPPLPQHGFKVSLSNRPTDYIWVDAGYNTLGWSTLQDGVRAQIECLKQESSRLTVISQEPIRLNTLRALRSVVRYKRVETGELMVQDLIFARRLEKKQIGIVYTLGLRTSSSRYDKDKRVLETVIKSWKLTSLLN